MLQEENFSEALSNASKVWAPPGISELHPFTCVALICSVHFGGQGTHQAFDKLVVCFMC